MMTSPWATWPGRAAGLVVTESTARGTTSECRTCALSGRLLQSQQQPVVVIGRVLEPVLVGQQGPEEGAQLQELMPVLVGAGQAAHLQAEDNADVVEANL